MDRNHLSVHSPMITPARIKKFLFNGLVYLILFFVIAQSISWWKSRDAMRGDLSQFNIELMDGGRMQISEHAGRSVLLYFWSTWCPICNLQKGSVQSISEDHPVISIASWSDTDEVKAYILENELTFPVMMDEDGHLARDFGLKGVPVSIILSPTGEMSFVETGFTTELGLRFRIWLAGI